MGESKLLLALFCNKILTKTERGVVVVVFSVPFGCVTLTVTLQHYSGGECDDNIANNENIHVKMKQEKVKRAQGIKLENVSQSPSAYNGGNARFISNMT